MYDSAPIQAFSGPVAAPVATAPNSVVTYGAMLSARTTFLNRPIANSVSPIAIGVRPVRSPAGSSNWRKISDWRTIGPAVT